jgi:DNA-binding transcriptional ArsR family regulator
MKITQAGTDLLIETVQLEKAALAFRAIKHPLRQQILHLLHKHKRMAVTTLYIRLKLEQSVASQHLAILRGAGFVNTKREARHIFYSVNYSRLTEVTKQATALIQVN